MNNLSASIATTREQSERLLAMGVKPETADMHYSEIPKCCGIENKETEDVFITEIGFPTRFPAWSLSRLISMMPEKIVKDRKAGNLFISHTDIAYFSFESDGKLCFLTGFTKGNEENVFDISIDMIDWLIKLHHFDKEYLKGGKP